MPKFIYKFDTIRKVKESLEKKVQKEVAEIDLSIEKYKKILQKLSDEEKEQSSKFTTNIKIVEIKERQAYLVSLKKKIENVQLQISALYLQREKKIQELIQKSKEHKIFDSLEDVYREQFDEEEKRVEMVQVNETATQRFVREMK
ncbi:MAG: flagellar export protein FliJ [Ignavibacteria bacterium]|nr:flagellar export protein FliJ [Ignavibacteria bacterium]